MVMNSYDSLKKWRDSEIENHLTDSAQLNHFHDSVMKNVYDIALDRVKKECGKPPCLFSWFVLGSAGRFEQAIISDQDHGWGTNLETGVPTFRLQESGGRGKPRECR